MHVHGCTFQMHLCRHFGDLTFSARAELGQGTASRCSQPPSEAACPQGGLGLGCRQPVSTNGGQTDPQQCKDAWTSVQALKKD